MPEFVPERIGEEFKVIGMRVAKMYLKELIDQPLEHSIEYRERKIKRSSGIILYGPPGVGKTFLVKNTAARLKLPFFYINITDIVSKFVGESPRKLHSLFAIAKKIQPVIVFFDEADVLLQSRDKIASGQGGGASELYMTITQGLQDISAINEDIDTCVFMIAATNQPWMIDVAHKRAGRFSYIVYIQPPNFWDRRKLFRLYFKNTRYLGKINFSLCAMATWGFSPKDIEQLCTLSDKRSVVSGKKITTRTIQLVLKSKIAGKSSLDEWYRTIYHEYLPEKRSILRVLTSKRYRQKNTREGKFTKADLETYELMIKDVNSYMRWRWVGRGLKFLARGF